MLFVKAQRLVALLDKHLDEQGMPHNKTVRGVTVISTAITR